MRQVWSLNNLCILYHNTQGADWGWCMRSGAGFREHHSFLHGLYGDLESSGSFIRVQKWFVAGWVSFQLSHEGTNTRWRERGFLFLPSPMFQTPTAKEGGEFVSHLRLSIVLKRPSLVARIRRLEFRVCRMCPGGFALLSIHVLSLSHGCLLGHVHAHVCKLAVCCVFLVQIWPKPLILGWWWCCVDGCLFLSKDAEDRIYLCGLLLKEFELNEFCQIIDDVWKLIVII